MDPVGEEARLYCDRNMAEPEERAFAGGRVAVFSARAPDKAPGAPNEDAAALIPWGAGGVLAVADGMGGGPLGERAAALAVETLRGSLAAAYVAGEGTGPAAGGALRAAVLDAFEQANREVRALGGGAGATLAVVTLEGGRARGFHVGDSLILVVGQRGRRKLQTVSHSPVGYAVEAGLLDESEALHHEDRHLVSNALGAADMHIEIGPVVPLAARDTLVVASDGLTDNLELVEIIEGLRAGPLRRGLHGVVETCEERMRGPQPGRPSKPDDLTCLAWRGTFFTS